MTRIGKKASSAAKSSQVSENLKKKAHVSPIGDGKEENKDSFVWVWGNPIDVLTDSDAPHAAKYQEYPHSDEECEEDLRRQNVASAEEALKYYNKKHRTNYELVDALTSSGLISDAVYIHCNFKAKKKRTSDDDGDSPTKLFFAEVCPSPPTVTKCCILKGNERGSCWHCEDFVEHPAHALLAGQVHNCPYALRSRSRSHSHSRAVY